MVYKRKDSPSIYLWTMCACVLLLLFMTPKVLRRLSVSPFRPFWWGTQDTSDKPAVGVDFGLGVIVRDIRVLFGCVHGGLRLIFLLRKNRYPTLQPYSATLVRRVSVPKRGSGETSRKVNGQARRYNSRRGPFPGNPFLDSLWEQVFSLWALGSDYRTLCDLGRLLGYLLEPLLRRETVPKSTLVPGLALNWH